MKYSFAIAALALAMAISPASAQERQQGPVFTGFGSWVEVENRLPVPAEVEVKAIFDTVRGAEPGSINGRIDSAARFINLFAAEGATGDRVSVALVIHGPANWDVTNDAAYQRQYPGQTNASAAAVAEMIEQGVQFYVCGQSAASMGLTADDLLPGVMMTHSQTVTTALLHAQGYANIP